MPPGLAILNPYLQKVDIYGEPFDKNGNRLIPGQYLWYHPPQGLAALNNAVGVLENLFSGIPEKTAYLKIHAEGPVLGLGLYGDFLRERLDVLYLNESG